MHKPETEEGLKRRAYSTGFKLKDSGLDQEAIYARLEKQGIPEELALQVANDVMIERQKAQNDLYEPFRHLAYIKIGIGVVAAIITMIILPSMTILPIGFIIAGVVFALASKKNKSHSNHF